MENLKNYENVFDYGVDSLGVIVLAHRLSSVGRQILKFQVVTKYLPGKTYLSTLPEPTQNPGTLSDWFWLGTQVVPAYKVVSSL